MNIYQISQACKIYQLRDIVIDEITPTDTWRNIDAMITSSLRQNDAGDVVWS